METILIVSNDLGTPVSIAQKGKSLFVVTYGLQVKHFDNWKDAFEEFAIVLRIPLNALECWLDE